MTEEVLFLRGKATIYLPGQNAKQKMAPLCYEGRIHSVFQQFYKHLLSTYHSPMPSRISQFSECRHMANRSLQHVVGTHGVLWAPRAPGQPGVSVEGALEELVMFALILEGKKGVNLGRKNGKTLLQSEKNGQRPDIVAAEKAGETRARGRRASCAMSRA